MTVALCRNHGMLTLMVSALLAQAGWTPVGDLENFEVTTIQGACPSASGDGHAFLLRSKKKDVTTGASIAQRFSLEPYAGKRVRFSAVVDAREVTRAGLFLRLISNEKAVLNDEMRDRFVTGTRTCERIAIVIDIPSAEELKNVKPFPVLSVGATLQGQGTLELTDVSFERVGDDVAVTDVVRKPAPPATPSRQTLVGPAPIDKWNSKPPSLAPAGPKRNATNPP
jgi:hypothetical protein